MFPSRDMFPLTRQCQNFHTVLGADDGVFPLGTKASVTGHGGPAVVQGLGAGLAHVDHGFHREHVAHLDEGGALGVAEMEHRGLFVEAPADAVAAVVFHHAETVLVGNVLDGATDVAETGPGFAGGADALFHAELGGVHQLLGEAGDLAYAEHGRGIAMVARKDGGDVDVHDIAVLENGIGTGNAVAHHFVDADAGVAGVAVVAHTGGAALVLVGVVTDELVDFQGGNAGLAHFTGENQGLGGKSPRIADKLDFFCRFYFNFSHF